MPLQQPTGNFVAKLPPQLEAGLQAKGYWQPDAPGAEPPKEAEPAPAEPKKKPRKRRSRGAKREE